ncbi:UNVERIFIED_CONTAM: hypothetical protein NCL1_60455 [Trichonephila clavipes]
MITRRKCYTHDFLAESQKCLKEHPPAKMQASHRRRRECQTLANTPGISRISTTTTAIHATRASSESTALA